MRSDALILSWLESESMDACADYVARGRGFATLAPAELSDAWIRALRTVVTDIANPAFRLTQGDLSSEFQLRTQQPPYHAVADELKRLMSETHRLLIDIGSTSPEHLEKIALHLEEQQRRFNDRDNDN